MTIHNMANTHANTANNDPNMTMRNPTKPSTYKKLLGVSLAAAVLTLSACGKKDTPVTEVEPTAPAQTQVETGVASANNSANDDVAVASADGNNEVTVDSMNDDVGVATADDYEIIDGTETEEHISTY